MMQKSVSQGRRGTTADASKLQADVMQAMAMETIEEEKFGEGVLDSEMSLIRRKTISIKADNVSDVIMQNMGSISESVATFKKMEEESSHNDVALNYQNKKENYEKQIEKLQNRLEKQTKQREEITTLANTLNPEVEQLNYEKAQYQEKINEVNEEQKELDKQIASSSVQEHEIHVVSALIEEKARLAEAKAQLKKSCKEEK